MGFFFTVLSYTCATTTVVVQSGKKLTRASDELNELLTAARCVRVTDPTKLITLLRRFDLVLYQPLRGRLNELVLVKPNPGGRHHAGLMVHLSNFYPENELGDFYPDAGYRYSLAYWQVFFFCLAPDMATPEPVFLLLFVRAQ